MSGQISNWTSALKKGTPESLIFSNPQVFWFEDLFLENFSKATRTRRNPLSRDKLADNVLTMPARLLLKGQEAACLAAFHFTPIRFSHPYNLDPFLMSPGKEMHTNCLLGAKLLII